jgi:hypothetical protein
MSTSEPTAKERAERRAGQLCGGEYDAGCPDCNLAVREFFIVWNEAIAAAAQVADEEIRQLLMLSRGGTMMSPNPGGLTENGKGQLAAWKEAARRIRALGGSDEGA